MNSATLAALVAVVAGLLLAPAVATLAHRSMSRPSPPSFLTGATVAAVAGVSASAAITGATVAGVVVGLPLIVFGLAAAIVDMREQRLPDALTGPLLLTTIAVISAATVAGADPAAALRSIAVAGAVTAGALTLKVVASASIGWGDVKLMPSLGAALGWWRSDAVLTAVLLWMVLIGITAAIVSYRQRSRAAVVPYGPALLVGTFGALVVGV